MKRKWELIKEWCCKHDYKDSAKLAEKIDEALNSLYKMKITPDHIRNHDEHFESDVLSRKKDRFEFFIGSRDYCTGCVVSKYTCSRCEFKKKHGECMGPDNEDSLFDEFLQSFANGE